MKRGVVPVLVLLLSLSSAAQNGGSVISGTIRTPQGLPIAGARIAAMDASGTLSIGATAESDDAGAYRLEHIPPGRWHIVAGQVNRPPVLHIGNGGAATIVGIPGGAEGVDFAVDAARLAQALSFQINNLPFNNPNNRQEDTSVVRLPRTTASACRSGGVSPTGAVRADDFVEIISVRPGPLTDTARPLPQYSVRLRGDGSVVWNGDRDVRVVGTATTQLSAEKAQELIERYRANGFWNLCVRGTPAPVNATNGGNNNTNAGGNGGTTKVRVAGQERGPVATGDQPWLADLSNEVLRLAGVFTWIEGDPGSLPMRTLFIHSESPIKPGVTPLMQASGRFNIPENVRALLAAKADPNARDSSGWTALMYTSVASSGQSTASEDIVRMLLAAGADLNARSLTGDTAIMAHLQSSGRSPGVIQLLIDAGANVNIANNSGQTALLLAVPTNNLALVNLLIKGGADVNATDSNGQTALALALRNILNVSNDPMAESVLARVNLVSVLKEAGARSDQRNPAGQTPLDILNADANRSQLTDAGKIQYDRVRRILERPAGATAAVPVRVTLRPKVGDIESVTLIRSGMDSAAVTAAVTPGGVAEFPPLPPGVYAVTTAPALLFEDASSPFGRGGRGARGGPAAARPVTTVEIAAGAGNPADVSVTVPALRKVRVRAATSDRSEAPVFWLIVAGPPGANAPVTPRTAREALPIPAALSDRIAGGANARLFQVGAGAQSFGSQIRTRLPFDLGAPVELPNLDARDYLLTLPEGDYAIAVLTEPAPNTSAPPRGGATGTAALFEAMAQMGARPTYTAALGVIDGSNTGGGLNTNTLVVNGSGHQIDVTLNRNPGPPQPSLSVEEAAEPLLSNVSCLATMPRLDPSRRKAAVELEARSVAKSLNLDEAQTRNLVNAYQSVRDSGTVGEAVAALRRQGVGNLNQLLELTQSADFSIAGQTAKLQSAFEGFLTADQTARAMESLGGLNHAACWDALVDEVAQFNLTPESRDKALTFIQAFVIPLGARGSPPRDALKERLDANILPLLNAAQAARWNQDTATVPVPAATGRGGRGD
jgi:ankyrin repeat protein